MTIRKILDDHDFVLAEAAVIEALRRSDHLELHPLLENALLIYEPDGQRALSGLYRDYIDVALKADVPIVICTPTWRANRERVAAARITVNCAYPSFLNADRQPQSVLSRLIGYQANASSLNHSQLDGARMLQANAISEWGTLMIELNQKFGIKILGGCCGTNRQHLEFIVENIKMKK